eukprot:Rhum_TRINITY_DN7766_c0_g1::Rhum_TRINITY_DN7766_c0_g1_i1::g.24596::m.24596
MVSLHSDAATVKRELTRLTRLNQQLQSNAMRDAEAHVDALSKAKEATRILEKKLSDARQEATHHCMKGRRLERELEERKQQLDQILTRHKLYDAAAAGAQAAHSFDAAPPSPLPPVARLRPAAASAPDAAAAAVVAVAHKRLAAAVAEAAARSREVSELRAEVAKGRAEAEQRSSDAERLYGLLLRASDGSEGAAELQAAAAAAATTGTAPEPLVQALHLQVSELQGELAVVRAAHEASEKAARDACAREADDGQLRAALRASEEEAAELRAALAAAEEAADAAEAAAAAAAAAGGGGGGVGGEAAADAARRLQQVAGLVADKEVLQRQLELLGAELLQARSESGGHLRALVAGQTKVNALIKEAAELRGRERAAAAAAAAAVADAADARRRAAESA